MLSPMEAINRRISTRRFNGQIISPELIEQIKSFAQNTPKLTAAPIKFYLRTASEFPVNFTGILGGYGRINRPSHIMWGVISRDYLSAVNYSFYMEQLVIYLTQLGIDTCWIAALFPRHILEQQLAINEFETVFAVIPFGYRDQNVSSAIIEKSVRLLVKHHHRLSLDELVSFDDRRSSLSDIRKKYPALLGMLEAVRLAPSGHNRQSWRFHIKDNRMDLLVGEAITKYKYYINTPFLDAGIAMAHIYLACQAVGLSFKGQLHDDPLDVKNGFHLIASYDLSQLTSSED